MLQSLLFAGALLAASASAALDQNAKTNVALYFGSGTNQQTLGHFCQTGPADVIPLAFLNEFLAQGNGYPGTNFGANTCNGTTFAAPGYMGTAAGGGLLDSGCNVLSQDILTCQSLGKKIVLSLGGAVGNYALQSVADGQNLADFLWAAFGPLQAGYTGPRPFDLGSGPVTVDGFDFDIEATANNNPRTDVNLGYYEALITRLREHYATDASKQYLITGAPQCIVPDANMNSMITNVAFDIVWVQYYNTNACSARNWVNANPNYATTGIENPSGFQTSWTGWTNTLRASASRNAKLYIGIPGSTVDVEAPQAQDVLAISELANLLRSEYFCDPYFGGIMIYEAQGADRIVDGGITFTQSVKNLLIADSQNSAQFSCVAGPSSTSSVASTTTISSVITSSVVSSTTVSSVISSIITSVSIGNFTTSTSLSTLVSTSATTSAVTVPVTSTSISVSASTGRLTTSTIQTTIISTIYQCASTVINCPYKTVVTSTIDLYTTVCPIGQTQTIPYAPSTKTDTTTITVTACPTTVPNCPASAMETSTKVQEIVYTVYYPVVPTEAPSAYKTRTVTTTIAKSTSTSSKSTSTSSPSSSAPAVASSSSASKTPSVVYSTIVVVPQASAPPAAVFVTVPIAASKNATVFATGTGVIYKPSATVVPYKGAAGRNAVGISAGLLAIMAGLLML